MRPSTPSAPVVLQVQDLLARKAAGEALRPEDEHALLQHARTLRDRVERLRALAPEAEVELAPELAELLAAAGRPLVLAPAAA